MIDMSETIESDFWKRKLLAFLHDPPTKALNIQEHVEISKDLIEIAFPQDHEVVFENFKSYFEKMADHVAASADRVIMPKPRVMTSDYDQDGISSFHHPLGGGSLDLHLSKRDHERELSQILQQIVGEGLDEPRKRFLKIWRNWKKEALNKFPEAAFFPADTRIPDHTIWQHAQVVSALQSCFDARDEYKFKPAFLMVKIGPVQEFISQARTTRDLWSGSYLLSWLIAHGIKEVTDELGPDSIISPSLWGQPLFDFLNSANFFNKPWKELTSEEKSKIGVSEEKILTPNLPNWFLAIVPRWKADAIAEKVKAKLQVELKNIGNGVQEWLKDKHPIEGEAQSRWNDQIGSFLQVIYQTWDWEEDNKKSFELFKDLSQSDGHDNLKKIEKLALDIPDTEKDPRNYKHSSWKVEGFYQWNSKIITEKVGDKEIAQIINSGFLWSAHYAMVYYFLSARRNTRDFQSWGSGDLDQRRGTVKDSYSGKEEVIGTEEWQKGLDKINGHYFKSGERLGAMNIIKRVWHKAYLEKEHGLKRTPRFDSLPSIAAEPLTQKILKRLSESSDAWAAFADFRESVQELKNPPFSISKESNDTHWILDSDGSLFHLNEWRRAESEVKDQKEIYTRIRSYLGNLIETLSQQVNGSEKADRTNNYIAVLAMDGDSMGEWVSGEKAPKLEEVLSQEAKEYFKDKRIDGIKRPLSPSYHLSLSEALGNFSVHLVAPVVEYFGGQLIYSGGDDVIAILPANKALDCALMIRSVFRGDPDLNSCDNNSDFDLFLEGKEGQKGFIALNGESKSFKKIKSSIPRGYHLLVPGSKSDISAGIVFGHMHHPLQDLVQEAHGALDQAKKVKDKGAFAVNLMKRSGESLSWSSKWESGALTLIRSLVHAIQSEEISSRFPYALEALIEPYANLDPETHQRDLKDSYNEGNNEEWTRFKQIIEKELEHVFSRQGKNASEDLKKTTMEWLKKSNSMNQFLGVFQTAAFFKKGEL